MKKLRNLRDLRERQALRQVDVAEMAGISTTTYRLLETLQHAPKPQTARAIADALGVEPVELWEEQDPKAAARVVARAS